VGLIEAARAGSDPSRGCGFRLLRPSGVDPPGHRPRPDGLLPASSNTIPQKNWPDQISMMKRRTADLKVELGRDPTREETARALGISETDLDDLQNPRRAGTCP